MLQYVLCLVAQSCPTLCDPMDCSPLGSSVHGILQAMSSSRGSSQPRGNSGLPHCRQILYHLSHQGSPRILGVGSLSFLQEIFLTQESNWGLLHCRLEKAMAPHSSTLAWKIPWTEEPGRLQSMGSRRVRHN